KWANDNQLLTFVMNRHQNQLQIMKCNPATGNSALLMEEKNKWYVDIHDDMTFLPDGKGYIWSSESDGYQHLYWYDSSGKLKKQLTKGEYDVTAFYGLDARRNVLYYQAASISPLQRE